MGYKTTDGLMRHLRNNGICISGSQQKRQLINAGYFHGYKGYRFYKVAKNRLPYRTFEEIYSTIQYDTRLKSLLYAKIMFIETAVKNIAIDCILQEANSENLQDIYDRVISSYKNAPANSNDAQKKKFQLEKLDIQGMIHSYLWKAYQRGNPKITHYFNTKLNDSVPIWAILEIMTMGDFGHFLKCLTWNARDILSRKLSIDLSSDTNRELIYKYIYTLKDLRNAIAHNEVVFDTRFRKIDPSKAMKQCLIHEIGLPYVNFKTIGDYVILVCYYLKLLKVSKTEIKTFIRQFERLTEDYMNTISSEVSAIVIHADLFSRLDMLKKYI